MRVPKTVSKLRAKDIDNRLPYAANFISAMAVGGINPDVIFERISRQKVFGEIQREFQYIYRDIAYYGDDVVTAVRKGIARSPSLKFRDFLQGIVTTITSGGELKP
jgi:flagellar protein FlaJ